MYEGVGNFCESVQSFAENLGHSIAEKVERTLGDKIGGAVTRQEIFDACTPGDLFEGLTARHSRELYYETHFNYKVRIWCKTCQTILFWSPLPYVLELCEHVCMYSHAKSSLGKLVPCMVLIIWLLADANCCAPWSREGMEVNKGQLKLEEVRHYSYVVDLLSSLKVCFCFCKVGCFCLFLVLMCGVLLLSFSCLADTTFTSHCLSNINHYNFCRGHFNPVVRSVQTSHKYPCSYPGQIRDSTS